MRTSRLSVVIAAIVMSWGAAATGHAQLPAKPPELRVLERFVGTWDYQVTTRAAVWTPRAAQSRGTATTQWTMGGWYAEERSRDRDGSESLGLWSYDAQARVYRAWLFLPGANMVGFASRWDESTQTFKGTTDLGNGIARTTTHHFPDRDTCEWAIVAKDRGGKVYLDITGTNRRRR